MTNWKSRKLWVGLVIFGVATGLLLLGEITSSEWTELTKWTFTAFVAANVGTHFAQKGDGNG